MIRITFLIVLYTFFLLTACQTETITDQAITNLTGYPEPTDLYQEAQFPFYHGVASGDPRSNQVVIWTRVTPRTAEPRVNVIWEIASDSAFTNILRRDDLQAMPLNDYVVKIDVKGLLPNTVYYYRFWSNNVYSPVGRTRTLATKGMETLRLAVVAGADYRNGDFSLYRQIAALDSITAVLQLGDYIQTGAAKTGDQRQHLPAAAPVTLADYRLRYSNYRTDTDLQAMHQAHPVISIWNDGEFADGAYFEGAVAHDDHTQNVWQFRKNMARQAYFDWLPIRMNADLRAYRSFQFGELAQLSLLDTRMEGRTISIYAPSVDGFAAKERSILGTQQQNWLDKKLADQEKWQIICTPALLAPFELTEKAAPVLTEQWSGFPAAQQDLLAILHKVSNPLILSSDLGINGVFNYKDKLYELAVPTLNGEAINPQLMTTLTEQYDAEISTKNGFLVLEIAADKVSGIWHFTDGSQRIWDYPF